MRAASTAFAAQLLRSHKIVTRVSSWRDGVQLAPAVPLDGGEVTFDDSGVLKRGLRLTVPARTRLASWDPGDDPNHPLNSYGQRLHVETGLRLPDGKLEFLDLGWYLIAAWQRDETDQTITVAATDLARLVTDADPLYGTDTPPAGQTFTAEVARILAGLGGQLTAVIDPRLPARTLAGGVVWEGNYGQAFDTLATGWPARWYVDDAARVRFAPPYPAVAAGAVPDVTVTDGRRGSITGRARGNERGRQYNAVTVTGNDTSDRDIIAARTVTGGPIQYDGPSGRVTKRYTSDALTTADQVEQVLDALWTRYTSFGRAETVHALPDPRIQLGDIAQVYTADGQEFLGRTTQISLPLTGAAGAMALTVTNTPPDTTGSA